MPVIKVFSVEPVTVEQAESMSADLEALCLELLRADSSAIQIAFATAIMPRGAPVLLEMHCRAQPHRDAAALAGFMAGAERSLLKHLRKVPRIRCFSVNVSSLSVRN